MQTYETSQQGPWWRLTMCSLKERKSDCFSLRRQIKENEGLNALEIKQLVDNDNHFDNNFFPLQKIQVSPCFQRLKCENCKLNSVWVLDCQSDKTIYYFQTL